MNTRRATLQRLAILAVPAPLLLAGCETVPERPAGPDLAAMMKDADARLAAKDFDGAIKAYQAVLAVDPKAWRAHLGIARAQIGKGAWTEAIASARRAHELNAAGEGVVAVLGDAFFGGGVAALKGNRLTDAIGLFADYIRLQPSNGRAYLNVARAFLGERRFAEALDSLVKGLGVASGGERGEILSTLRDAARQAISGSSWRDAIAILREYLRHDRSSLDAWLDLARSYWRGGERLNALDAFRRVLELDPRHEEALRFLRGG